MPHVATLILQMQTPDGTNSSTETLAENLPLFLPSSLPPRIRALSELKDICNLERRLREPQADDALAEVRRQRRVIQGLWLFKRLNVSGTGNRPNTRMIDLYKRFNDKTDRAAQKYRTAWRALSTLDPDGLWLERLKELKSNDVSGPGRDPGETTATNSRYEPSWIWLVQRVSQPTGSELEIGVDEFNQSMRVEWSKARARMMRWKEELMLIQEEMRRVIAYHEWKANWWHKRGVMPRHDNPDISSGISGYAHKQADISTRLAEECARHWLPCLKERGIRPVWASEYEHLISAPCDGEKNSDEADLDGVEDDCDDEEGDEEHEEHEVEEGYCNLDDIDF